LKILYVEDNSADTDLLHRELLQLAPEISITSVHTVKQALSKLNEKVEIPFELVLIDLHLPDGSGMELLNQIRANRMPFAVVILTGQGDEHTALAALKSGADDYIPKSQDYLHKMPAVLENALVRFKSENEMQTRSLWVLYAEHDSNDIDLTRRHLTAHAPFIQLNAVNTAEQVLAALEKQGKPAEWDVILLDYHLPGMNALDAIREIRQLGDHPPIIVITGQGDEEVAAQALRLGALDYIIKNPGYLFELAPAIQSAYHRAKVDREHKALVESEQRFQRLVHNAQDLIYRFRILPSHGFEYVSPAATTLTGYSSEDYYLNPDFETKLVYPEDLPLFQAASMGTSSFDKSIVMRWVHKDGRLIWTEQRYAPIRDEKGTLVALEGIARDITDRKQAEQAMIDYNARLEIDVQARTKELRDAQETLIKQERQATFGQLAGGVAHELRNPLGVIANAVYYLRLIVPQSEEKILEYLGILERESKTAVQIISDLLNFSSVETGDRQPSNAADLIQAVLMKHPLPKRIALELKIPKSIPMVFVDAHQIEQAIERLVVNACEAMEGAGILEISVDRSVTQKKSFVTIAIEDNGSGISPENQLKIFEPLFTTKTRRIGLGLALSKRLIEVNGGRIEAKSTEGKGATFTLHLPIKMEHKE
jgi:PAS domain S-box-containing protein